MPVVPKPRTLDEQVAEIWEYLRKLKRTGIIGQPGAAGATGATGAAGAPGPAGPGHIVEDEGIALPAQPNLNFVGAGVTVTDAAPDTLVTIPGASGLALPTPTTPARAFNTTFQPHATRPVLCIYTVRIASDDGETGNVILRSDAASPPVTQRCAVRNAFNVTGVLGVGGTSTIDSLLVYMVPAAHFVRLDTTVVGAPAFTLVLQVEEIL